MKTADIRLPIKYYAKKKKKSCRMDIYIALHMDF